MLGTLKLKILLAFFDDFNMISSKQFHEKKRLIVKSRDDNDHNKVMSIFLLLTFFNE